MSLYLTQPGADGFARVVQVDGRRAGRTSQYLDHFPPHKFSRMVYGPSTLLRRSIERANVEFAALTAGISQDG